MPEFDDFFSKQPNDAGALTERASYLLRAMRQFGSSMMPEHPISRRSQAEMLMERLREESLKLEDIPGAKLCLT